MRACAPAPSTRCVQCPGCSLHLPLLLADLDADVRLLSCELARGLPDEDANRLLCQLLEAETEKNVCAAAVEVLAEIGRPEALPALTRCATRFDSDPFIAFSIKVAIDRIVAPPSSRRRETPRSRRRNSARSANSSTGAPACSSRRPSAITSSDAISDRMAFLDISSFTTYFAYLRSDAEGEIEKFINAFTVNETYFYREEHQLRCLSSDLLAERVLAKRPGEALRIWSVPCATGEEPYSIALWLLENWPEVDVQDIEIMGSDIDTAVRGGRARTANSVSAR